MKKHLFLIFFGFSIYSNAQEVQWASKVINFSSQLSEYEYAASQVLGIPDVLPNAGDNPNAWLPNKPNKVEYVKVGFEKPMKVQQIAIGESYNPGSVYQVYLYDSQNNEHLLNTFLPRPLNVKGRLLNIYLSETEYAVSAVKIVIDGSKVDGYNGIDAIGISGTTVPILADKEEAFRRNPGLDNMIINLGAENRISDSRPVFSENLQLLFFTRAFSPLNVGGDEDTGDIWVSEFNNGSTSFSSPRPLNEAINNIGMTTSNDFLLVNGKSSLLLGNVSGKPDKVATNVVITDREGDDWNKSDELKIKNARIGSIDADYTIAENGTVLIISAYRYDTEGGRDIYISFLEGENKWSEPKNIGSVINTTMDEYSPFYSEGERALYFSTAGYPGSGGGDIFRVTRLGESWDSWSTPENIGTDINTEMDEKYFFFDDDDDYAYFSRAAEDSVYGIVRVERPKFLKKTPMVALLGKVVDAVDKSPVNSVISLMILPEERTYGMTFSDQSNGSFQLSLPSGNQFTLIAEKEGYEPYEIDLSLENKNEPYQYELNLALARIPELVVEADEEIIMPLEFEEVPSSIEDTGIVLVQEITFEFESDQPVPESLPTLETLAKVLIERPDLNIEVAGFTDHIGNEKYNARLAIKRAESVKDILVDKGVKASRIAVIGFGERMPLIMSDDIKDLQVNRRVEFNFTKK